MRSIETVTVAGHLTGIRVADGTIGPVVAVGDPCDKAVTIAGAVEGTQVSVNVVGISAIPMDDKNATAIIRIIEIRVIAGIPHVIAVPSEIRISESQAESIGKAVSVHGIAISESHAVVGADRG